MSSLVAKTGSRIHQQVPTNRCFVNGKSCGLAIAIIGIGCIGALALVGAGATGYCHVGALSNMASIDAIILMAVGGGGGMLLFIPGLIATIKSQQVDQSSPSEKRNSLETDKSIDHTSFSPREDRLVYGPEIWPDLGRYWGCSLEILGEIPKIPGEDVGEGRIRIYIPEKVKINDQEKNFTLNTLIDTNPKLFEFIRAGVKEQFGNKTATGWIEIDKNVVVEDEKKSPKVYAQRAEDRGGRLPCILEAIVFSGVLSAFTEQPMYNQLTMICSEKVDERYPVYFDKSSVGKITLSYFYENRFYEARKFGAVTAWQLQ